MVENLLKNRFGDKYEFFSAGITPMSQPNMDPRSVKFLDENNIDHEFHTPKKINHKMMDYFDKFLAVDFLVLSQLNMMFPKFKSKFRSLTSQFSDRNIIDPYQLQPDKYEMVMNDIKHIVEKINLEEL